MLSRYPQENECILRCLCDGSKGMVKILNLIYNNDRYRIYKIKILWVNNKLKKIFKIGEIENFVVDLKEDSYRETITQWKGR